MGEREKMSNDIKMVLLLTVLLSLFTWLFFPMHTESFFYLCSDLTNNTIATNLECLI